MTIPTVTVTGYFEDAEGNPATGTVAFRLNTQLSDSSDDQQVPRTPIVATLVDGAFTQVLAATSGPDIQPSSGVIYWVTERIAGSRARRYRIALPYTDPTVDLADLSPATGSSLVWTVPTIDVVGGDGALPDGIFDVSAYGAVADNGVTDNTAAFDLAVAALNAAGGGTLYFPPSAASYKGNLTFTANVPTQIDGYGAIILAPDSSYGVKVARGGGASILPFNSKGLHVKGPANKSAVGVWVYDSDNVRFEDTYIERCAVGRKIENHSTTLGCESGDWDGLVLNNCTIGTDFVVSPGFAGEGSFMQFRERAVKVNNCATGLRMPYGEDLFRRCVFDESFWVPTGGVMVDCDADMRAVTAAFRGEAYNGGSGLTGILLGANSVNWEYGTIDLNIPAVISTKINTTSATASRMFVWREGSQWWQVMTAGTPIVADFSRPSATSGLPVLTINGQVRADQGLATRYLTGSGRVTASDADFGGGATNGQMAVLNDSAAGGKQRLAIRVGGVWRYIEIIQTIYDFRGAGSPEGAVTAPVGSTYNRTDGGAGTSFYVKESGVGNTGWVAK